MNPKKAGCCSICDAYVREVKARDQDGNVTRMGRAYEGTKIVTLVHLDGTHSDHSVCAGCEVLPEHLPTLWKRAVMLYAEGVKDGHDFHAKYGRNVPVAIVSHREVYK